MQRALEGLSGVREVTVEFEKQRAILAFDPSRASPALIADTVRSLGFGVELPTPVTQETA